MEKYFEGFSSREDLENMWAGTQLGEAVVIAAVYTTGDYEGSAWCVYRLHGKLYEVHCSHCSCNGLDHWEPEEISYEALINRLDKTTSYDVEHYGEGFALALRRGLVDEQFDREVLEN